MLVDYALDGETKRPEVVRWTRTTFVAFFAFLGLIPMAVVEGLVRWLFGVEWVRQADGSIEWAFAVPLWFWGIWVMLRVDEWLSTTKR